MPLLIPLVPVFLLLGAPGCASSAGEAATGDASSSSVTLLIIYVSLALGFSFLCSVLEAVLLSITPSFLAGFEAENKVVGQAMRRMKENIDRPLSAILSLNTIAHTVGAAGAGAQAAKVFGDAYLGVISAVLTLLILFVSEIIPKTLGAVYWRQLAPMVVRALVPIEWAMWPLVKVSELITKLVAGGKKKGGFSRDEFRALAEIGKREGAFGATESRIMTRLFQFEDVQARDIMTPRTVVFVLEEEQTVDEVLAAHEDLRFSRIPVVGKDRDDVKGFVLKTDLLLHATRGKGGERLSSFMRPLDVVPTSMGLPVLLDRLTTERQHVALVIDEYGGTAGLVTLEDILETLIGVEIVDEADAVQDMQALARKAWDERARRLGLVPEDEESPER